MNRVLAAAVLAVLVAAGCGTAPAPAPAGGRLARRADGTTETTEAASAIVPGADPEVDAVVTAHRTSTTG